MLKYGSDKPDLRPGMAIADLLPAFAESPFPCFATRCRRRRASADSSCRAPRELLAQGARRSRREQARQLGASGLAWARLGDGGRHRARR